MPVKKAMTKKSAGKKAIIANSPSKKSIAVTNGTAESQDSKKGIGKRGKIATPLATKEAVWTKIQTAEGWRRKHRTRKNSNKTR